MLGNIIRFSKIGNGIAKGTTIALITILLVAAGKPPTEPAPKCAEYFNLYRSEATKIEDKQTVVAYHRECVATSAETGECTHIVTMPDYDTSQVTAPTGVLGALKIQNKDKDKVTITEVMINHRDTAQCHWNGNRDLQQGDAMTFNSDACGDILNVQIRTPTSACGFNW